MVFNMIIGVFGMTLILVAFLLDEFSKKITQKTIAYNLLNLFGSLGLVYYAYTIEGWPFLILNLIWFIAALTKIYLLYKKLEVKNNKWIEIGDFDF